MDDNKMQQLIEEAMSKNQFAKIRNKEEELYTSIMEELNQMEEPSISYQFSEKVTREAIKRKAIQERFETKLKMVGIFLSTLIIAGVVFTIFGVNFSFLTTIPVSYYLYGLAALIMFLLIELGDLYLLKQN